MPWLSYGSHFEIQNGHHGKPTGSSIFRIFGKSQFSKTNFVNFKVINPTCIMKMSLAAFFKFKLDSEQTPFLTMLYDFVQQKATYFLKSLVILVY